MKSFSQHRIIRQLICFAMAIFICSSFIPLRADAYTDKYSYTIIPLEQYTYVTAEGGSYTYNDETAAWTDAYCLYEISVPDDGIVKIEATSWKNDFSLYKTIDTSTYLYASDPLCELYGVRIYYRVLQKGTYYIYASKGVTFEWSFHEPDNPTNYCRALATELKAGKRKNIFFNYGCETDRWYKIVLPKKKSITITLKNVDEYCPEFKMYNSKGLYIKCPPLTNNSCKTSRLKKGTYYIRVMRSVNEEDEYNYCEGRFSQITWK